MGALPAPASEEALPEWATPADDKARRMVYLVTLSSILTDPSPSHTQGLRDPSPMTKEEVRDAVLDAVANPVVVQTNRGGRPRSRVIGVVKYLGVKEEHASRPGEFHHHIALKLSCETAFLPLKASLRQRHGLASHWSTQHRLYWSAVRYIAFASEKKPVVDDAPVAWTATGAPLNLYEEGQEPFNAMAVKRRREACAMRPTEADEGAKKAPGTSRERFGKLDLTSLVLAEKLSTPAQVMSYVQSKGSAAMQAYVHKNQRRLQEAIDEAFAWEAAPRDAAQEAETDWALIERLSRDSCVCGAQGCRWWTAAEEFFAKNAERPGNAGVDRQLLAASLRLVIEQGPSKVARVPLMTGPSNSGKSTILDPVREVFGWGKIFNKPKLGAPCPLSKLNRGKRFIYFDDFRPVEYAALPRDNPTISTTTFLAMFQGQPFDIQVSQSFNDGHPEVTWRRGAAMTAKAEGLWQQVGSVAMEDIRHMQSRVIQFSAHHVIPTESFQQVPMCRESWARWLVIDSAAFAARPALRPPSTLPIVDDEDL